MTKLYDEINYLPGPILYKPTPQAPTPVWVKPLVWEVDTDKRDGRTHYGYGVFGHWYAVFREKTGAWGVFHFVSGKRTSLHPADSDTYPTLEAAKAAAQADYERRILAALDTPAPALMDELVEALRQFEAHYPRGINPFLDDAHAKARAVLAKIGGAA